MVCPSCTHRELSASFAASAVKTQALRNVCKDLNPLERLAYYLLGWVHTWPSMAAHAAKGKWKTTSGEAVVSGDREELCRG